MEAVELKLCGQAVARRQRVGITHVGIGGVHSAEGHSLMANAYCAQEGRPVEVGKLAWDSHVTYLEIEVLEHREANGCMGGKARVEGPQRAVLLPRA